MMRRTWWAALMALLVAVPLWLTPQTAHGAGEVHWRKGWCYKGEGVAQVMNFVNMAQEQWPEGNRLGYDVRCIYGPGIQALSSPTGISGWNTTPLSGIPMGIAPGGGLTTFWGIPSWVCFGGSFERGWGAAETDAIDAFAYCSNVGNGGGEAPAVVPQFLSGTNPNPNPDTQPTAESPGDQGVPQPGQVTRPPSGGGNQGTGNQGTGNQGQGGTGATIAPTTGPNAANPAATRAAAQRTVSALPSATPTDTPSATPTPTSTPSDSPVYQEEAANALANHAPPLGSLQNTWTLVLGIAGVLLAVGLGVWVGTRGHSRKKAS